MNALAWMCIVLGVMLFIQTLRQWRTADKLHKYRIKATDKIVELYRRDQVQAYHALEQGMDEQQESYEQEYLTWAEQKEELLEIIHQKNLRIDNLTVDVVYLLGFGYDLKDLTEDDINKMRDIHDRVLPAEGRKNTS